MEDDDEFGDLYTDVLRPFASSSSLASASQPHQPSPAPPSLHSPIDLNLKSSNDDDGIVFGAPHSSSTAPNQTLALQPKEPVREAVKLDLAPNSIAREDSAGGARVLEAGDVELPRRTGPEAGVVESEALSRGGGEGGVDLMDKDVNFDIEEGNTGIDDIGSEPIIPGLSGGGGSGSGSGGDAMVRGLTVNLEASRKDDASGGGGGGGGGGGSGSGENDWDSDSDDDLQIVLNDNNHGPMAMERGGIGGEEDDDDEDGDPLVIVADGELNQEMEVQEWGDDAAQAADGEKKETGDAGKVIGGGVHVGAVVAPKIGYSNHGYHPFHSQFKYVRPGAVPMSGAATSIPGGGPGQVRPLVNMGPMAGRGRGEWRPTGIKNASPMQKGFHSGFGLPAWGNNMAGRGFGGGGGLEFTLPSHKTIFDVDIESFEEKPWKYPGIDISDFFNFGLNEESWKDYCRQLEQLRLESTMQSKIRVYESGRTEQEYDPDLPPELAAATGVHDVLAENANSGKLDVGQSDLAKGSARVRPPIPTGRAIQVEGGYGERLPSIDTRPPRMRDSDAIIEIVLQDSVDDDSSTGNAPEQPDNETPREDFRGGDVAEEGAEQVDSEYFDGFPQAYNVRKRDLGRRMPSVNSGQDNLNDGDGISSFPPEAPVQISSSRGQTSGKVGTPYDERRTQERARDQSPHMAPSRSTHDGKFHDDQKEESVESLDGKHSPRLSSPVTVRVARESSVEQKDAEHDELLLADGSPVMEKDEMTLNTIGKNDTLKDGVLNKQKLSSHVEKPVLQEFDEGEDSKAARSSENSKARSGSSRDYQKWRDGADEEVIQEGRSTRTESMKRHLDDNEQGLRRKNRDGRQDIERSRMAVKGTEDYLYRDWDPSSGHQMHMKADGFNRRKERDNPEIPWQRRDDDPYNRRIRAEETRKRERGEEMGSRHRGKVRDGERSDKDEFLHSRKQLDNGNYRIPYDKEAGSRHRERDDGLKSRYENVDDYHGKRRKDEEYLRRDHADKEEILHGHRESTSRRKRERDEVLDPRKRDDQLRLRDNLEDHHSVRHKDEGWLQRERGERPPREREDWHRLKQSHEENLPKRERDEGRGALRGGRGPEEKALAGHSRAKEEYKGSDKEYQFKDTVRHSEQSKRRDRIEDENSHYRGREDVYPRGNQFSNDERRSRQERSSTRNDRAVSASDNQRVHDKKHRENTRKNKESEGGDHNAIGPSKRNREDQSGQINETGLKGSGDQGNGEREVPVQRHVSRKHREDVSSEDEQLDSKRGRSKLERWTSHAERDFSINSRPSSSLKFKESDRNINGASSEATKPLDESANTVEIVDNQHPSAEEKDAGDLESKDADTKPLEERHLEDTVEKLKKRSERFKLPLPSEKEVLVIKKIESEALPSAKIETPVESEIKPERPARKRRWVSN